ncbi:hypothetical protein Nmel_006435 [Mimus melanotis]
MRCYTVTLAGCKYLLFLHPLFQCNAAWCLIWVISAINPGIFNVSAYRILTKGQEIQDLSQKKNEEKLPRSEVRCAHA